jgi:signal transduction histidine kinase
MNRLATQRTDDGIEFDVQQELIRLQHEVLSLRQQADRLRDAAQLVLDEPDTRRLCKSMAREFGLLVSAERAWVVVLLDGETVGQGVWDSQNTASNFIPSSDAESEAAANAMRSLETSRTSHSDGYEIATPILDHQRRIRGVLQARSSVPFLPEHSRAAQAFALQAALGLERGRMFDRMGDWTRSLERLLSFNALINQRVEPTQLVRRLVESAAAFLDAEGGWTGLSVPADAPGGRVMITDAYWYRGKWQERHARWELNEGIPGFLLESAFPYISNEYQEDDRADQSLIDDYGVCRTLCVPIRNMDETILGFFQLFRGSRTAPFTWQDAAFLESLSNTTAVAIHNAQLIKSLEIKNEQIQALSANHVKQLEEERAHIARELHDEAGQVMIGIKLALQVLAHKVPAEPPQLREDFGRLRELVNLSTGQIRGLARRLRSPILDRFGFSIALRQMAADFSALTGTSITCDLCGLPDRLPQDLEVALYRIAQEALTNAARHANAKHITLALGAEGDSLSFSITDDGCGFDREAIGSGLGLLGMRERADMLHGRFALESTPGAGTRIMVTFRHEYSADNSR